MRKTGKKLIALLLAATMTLTMAGCGKKAESTKTDTNPTEASGESETDESKKENGDVAQNIDTSEHVKIKFVVLGNKPTNGRLENMLKVLNEKMTEQINAEIEMHYVEWADWQTQYNLLLASGDDTVDLITTATDWLDAWPNVKRGAFLPLTEEMLKTYAPKTWESVSQEHWEECKYEGEIYLVPEDNYAQYTNHGMFYRGDWASEFGIDEVKSFEDLGRYFQGVKDNKEGVIPWDVSGTSANGNALANGYIQSTTQNILIDGIPIGLSTLFFGTSSSDPYTLTSPYMEGSTFEDFAKLMKSWADAGYWREDVLNYNGETRDLMYAGQSGADQHHSQMYYTTVKPLMDQKQPGSDVKMFPFSEPSKNLVKLVNTHGALAVGANSKHPERALMAYDLLRNDETFYRLLNYGIEGTDYIITEDGRLGRPDGWDKTTDALDSNFWCGRNDNLELNDVEWWDGKDGMIEEYNSYAVDYPYGKLIVDTSNITTEISAMSDVCNNYIPRIAFGKSEDPVADVAAFRKELEAAGYQKVFDELQSQLNTLKESAN